MTPTPCRFDWFQMKHPNSQVEKGHFQEFKAAIVGYLSGLRCQTCIDLKGAIDNPNDANTGDQAAGPPPISYTIPPPMPIQDVQPSSSSSSSSTAIVPAQTGLVTANLGPQSISFVVVNICRPGVRRTGTFFITSIRMVK